MRIGAVAFGAVGLVLIWSAVHDARLSTSLRDLLHRAGGQ